eukprot:1354094-Amorphochlora_amoeboformis.AAC.1
MQPQHGFGQQQVANNLVQPRQLRDHHICDSTFSWFRLDRIRTDVPHGVAPLPYNGTEGISGRAGGSLSP